MTHKFFKYQGTGNDFVIIDNRRLEFDKNDTKLIARLCDRRFGIGADGLILLEPHDTADFRMVYYNADGNESSMCGNGGRCITAFARQLGIIDSEASFEAIDGMHESWIDGDRVTLKMQDVNAIQDLSPNVVLDTGSPHLVIPHETIEAIDVKKEGASIRYSETYAEAGINVNFVDKLGPNAFAVRTYERGVEDETLSCGTGVVAVALAMHFRGATDDHQIEISTRGGTLNVSFTKRGSGYADIWLTGPAQLVYNGDMIW